MFGNIIQFAAQIELANKSISFRKQQNCWKIRFAVTEHAGIEYTKMEIDLETAGWQV